MYKVRVGEVGRERGQEKREKKCRGNRDGWKLYTPTCYWFRFSENPEDPSYKAKSRTHGFSHSSWALLFEEYSYISTSNFLFCLCWTTLTDSLPVLLFYPTLFRDRDVLPRCTTYPSVNHGIPPQLLRLADTQFLATSQIHPMPLCSLRFHVRARYYCYDSFCESVLSITSSPLKISIQNTSC